MRDPSEVRTFDAFVLMLFWLAIAWVAAAIVAGLPIALVRLVAGDFHGLGTIWLALTSVVFAFLGNIVFRATLCWSILPRFAARPSPPPPAAATPQPRVSH